MSPLQENLDRVVNDFIENGGKYILNMGTEPEDWASVLEDAKKYSKYSVIYSALGIHPTIYAEKIGNFENGLDIFKYSQKILTKLEDLFEENSKNIIAVGETGLDYYHTHKEANLTDEQIKDVLEVQKNSFRKNCQLAVKYSLPMSIHARELNGKEECVNDALKILAEVGKGNIKGVFHSYTGTMDGLKKILDMGFYIGFNAIITYPSGENVRKILKETPLDRILFETDGPFLPTQSVRKNSKKTDLCCGKPSSVKEIIKIAAEIKGISPERLEEESDKNFELLFGISSN
jgi:TatD DNase family protein